MSGAYAGGEQLNVAWRTLCSCWEETKAVWDDRVRRDFEKEYWTGLEAEVQATQRELERLAQVLARVQRDVK